MSVRRASSRLTSETTITTAASARSIRTRQSCRSGVWSPHRLSQGVHRRRVATAPLLLDGPCPSQSALLLMVQCCLLAPDEPSFCWYPLFIPIETPITGRGGCSRMPVSSTATAQLRPSCLAAPTYLSPQSPDLISTSTCFATAYPGPAGSAQPAHLARTLANHRCSQPPCRALPPHTHPPRRRRSSTSSKSGPSFAGAHSITVEWQRPQPPDAPGAAVPADWLRRALHPVAAGAAAGPRHHAEQGPTQTAAHVVI